MTCIRYFQLGMDFIKNVYSNTQKECKHSGIENVSNATQIENQSSQISEDNDFEEIIIDNFDDIATDKNITKQTDFDKTELEFIDKPNIANTTADIINCSNCNYSENKIDSNEIDKELISVSLNSNFAPKTPDEDKDSSKTLIDNLDIDKNITLNKDCTASEINLDKISIVDICIDKTKDKTDSELSDSNLNKDLDNESVTSDSILLGIDLDEEYYLDRVSNGSDNIKYTVDNSNNLITELENTCIETNVSESCNDLTQINNEASYLVDLDNIDNNDKNVCNSEMLVSLEEFDRILQRYKNNNEKYSHWDPNDYKKFDTNIIDPLSIDEIDDFINNLNETQQFITKPMDVIEIDTRREFDNNEQYSPPIKPHNQFDAELKDDIISISSEENIELLNESYDDNKIDTISLISSDSDCSGYHSSDFEFISEGEAKLDGFIINNVAPKVDKPVSRFERPNIIRSSNKELSGPSNRINLSNRENSPNYQDNNIREVPQIHEIPEGDNYINLFHGIYNPVLPHSAIFFLENKSVRVTGMHVEFEGLGFDRQIAERRRLDDSDDEFKEEAQENIKKILYMYPGENGKRKRKF